MLRTTIIVTLSASVSVAGCSANPTYGSGACINKNPNWIELPKAYDAAPFGLGGAEYNVLAISPDSKLRWNGQPNSLETVEGYINLVAEMRAYSGATLILRPSPGVPCIDVIEWRRKIAEKLGCQQAGDCGEGSHYDQFKERRP